MADIPANIDATVTIKKFIITPEAQAQLDELSTSIGAGGEGEGGDVGTEVAGAVTAIGALTTVIKMFTSNSKIMNTLLATLGKAMGLLVDVILLPFMPIFIFVLMGLFKNIMKFYALWKEIWDAKAIQDVVKWLKKWADYTNAGFLLAMFVSASAALGAWIWDILKWIYDSAGKINLEFIAATATGFLKWVYENLYNLGKAIVVPLEFAASKVAEFIMWVWYMILGIGNSIALNFNLGSIAETVQRIIDLAKNGLSVVVNFVGKGLSGYVGDMSASLNRKVEHLAGGGFIKETGLAVVHKGETVTPAGKGGVTVNISGQFKSDEEMYRRFVDRLRQEQWRTNV